MNYDEGFPQFINYLRKNNIVNSMSNYGVFYSNPYNLSQFHDSYSSPFFSLQSKYDKLNEKVDELNEILKNFHFNSNHRYKKIRLNRKYNDFEDNFEKRQYHKKNREKRYLKKRNRRYKDDLYDSENLESDGEFEYYHKGKNSISEKHQKNNNLEHKITKNVHFKLQKNKKTFYTPVDDSDDDDIVIINNKYKERNEPISQVKESDNSTTEEEEENNQNNKNISIYKKKKKFQRSKFLPKLYYPYINEKPKKKYLIVLDIFNMLYQRVTIDSVSSLIKISPNYKLKNAYIYLRPFLDTFLKELFNITSEDENDKESGFEIAIWNTTKPFINTEITEIIFKDVPIDSTGKKTVNYLEKFHFNWTVDQCEYNESDNDEEPVFKRNIETIIDNKSVKIVNNIIYPPVNKYNHWKENNIILITSLNPNFIPKNGNYLYIPPYDVSNLQMEAKKDTALLSLIQYLKNLLKANPSNVIDYLNSNLFCVQKKNDYGIIKSLKISSPTDWENEDYPNKIRQTEFYITQSKIEEMNIKYGNGRKKSNVIYKPIPFKPKNKYLIIFDLNGTLLHRLKNNSIVDKSTRVADFSINGRFVFLRPYIDSFIEALFNIDGDNKDRLESGFAVGAWTSAIVKNSELMLSQILKIDKRKKKNNQLITCDYSNRIFFKWARDFCTPIPDTDHETEKNMENLWNHKKDTYCKGTLYPAVNGYNHWSEKNTIIIDDSPHKAKQYPYNAIHIPTYEVTNKDGENETVLLSLIKYLKVLYKKEPSDVQIYLKKHPFSKITIDENIESDDTLSKQEKFDKLKESTKIRIKSKWIVKTKDDIEQYANNHPKFRESRLQINIPDFLNNNKTFPPGHEKSFKRKASINEYSKDHKKRKALESKIKNKENKENINENVNEKSDIVNSKDYKENQNVHYKKDSNETFKNVKNKKDLLPKSEKIIPSINKNKKTNVINDDNYDDDDSICDQNPVKNTLSEENDQEEEEEYTAEYDNSFDNSNLAMDNDTMDMLLEMQQLTNAVKSTASINQNPMLFKRGFLK